MKFLLNSGTEIALERKLHPLGLGLPDDVVNPILFLLSSDSKWITGQVICVDGGYSVQ